ncbi:hypothetical protein KJ766_00905, partial [Patescibacteria group bacterium]|nr:hypothetical protein [Patescibacteria group bacterium]
GDLYLSDNKGIDLIGLENIKLGGGLYLGACDLTSATHLPNIISGDLILSGNEGIDLTGLENITLGGGLYLMYCNLTSATHLPNNIPGVLNLSGNPDLKEMKHGVSVGGKIICSRNMQEFADDARSKGYTVDMQ